MKQKESIKQVYPHPATERVVSIKPVDKNTPVIELPDGTGKGKTAEKTILGENLHEK